MNVVGVIAYDRLHNITEWLRCWKQTRDYIPHTELVIVHNFKNPTQQKEVRRMCAMEGVTCISRKNVGMDIGAFQDICRGRLKGFPDFERLLWCTDDVWPMRKTFINEMFSPFDEPDQYGNVPAVVGLEMSLTIKQHIRTTCFAIRKEIVQVLRFPCDPVITKDDCYAFEHKSEHALYEQGQMMGGCVWHSQLPRAPLWDTGHRMGFNRIEEHFKHFQV
jgi:hypothetical protein